MKDPLGKTRKYPTERQLWARIRPKLNVDYDRAYRIEAIATPGFPDVVWFPYQVGSVLIELKAGPLRFREAQRKFANDMYALGTVVWLIWQAHRRDAPVVYRLIDKVNPGGLGGGAYDLDKWIALIRETTTYEQKLPRSRQ
jgi:hypothetical protein